MEKSNKLLIGLGLFGLIGYYLYKNKSTANTPNIPKQKGGSSEKVIENSIPSTPQIPVNKPIVAEVTKASPAPVFTPTPIVKANPISKAEPIVYNPIVHPETGKLVAPTTPIVIPSEVDFEQYFKDHPIEFNYNPDVTSTLVVNPPAYGNTDPFAQYQNCISLKEYFDKKDRGINMSNTCIIGNSKPISEKDMQNAFKMQEFQNEFSRDPLGLNTFMTQGQDHSNDGSGNNNGNPAGAGSPIFRGDQDPFGYGGVPST
jgi:hypothetical protein